MSIGYTIKRLRREKDITQEQLAEYLGITSRAISQWECERASPDISQIPILCNIFNVSADILLGIDIEQKEKKIEEYLNKAEERWSSGYDSEGMEILREAYKEYPDSHKIICALMQCTWGCRNDSEIAEEREKLKKEVISLGERLLAECTDTEIRNEAVQLLCYTYPEIGETEKAVFLANQMPGRYLSKESLLSSIYSGTKRFEIKRRELYAMADDMFDNMLYNNMPLDNGEKPYSNDEMIEILKKYLSIMDIFFEDGNFLRHSQSISWANIFLAKYYMKAEKPKEALDSLHTAKKYSIIRDTEYGENSTYTCLLFRGMKIGRVSHNTTENDCLYQLSEMEDSVFDRIRETPEFTEITNELKKYAGHH